MSRSRRRGIPSPSPPPFLAAPSITLTSGELIINKNLTIDGDLNDDGGADITVSAASTSRVFNVTAGNVAIDGLIITQGLVSGNGGDGNGAGGSGVGAGIRNASTLTLENSVISNNRGTGGGGSGSSETRGAAGGGGGGFNSVGGGNGGIGYRNARTASNAAAGGTGANGVGGGGGGNDVNVADGTGNGRNGNDATTPGLGGIDGANSSNRTGGNGGSGTSGGLGGVSYATNTGGAGGNGGFTAGVGGGGGGAGYRENNDPARVGGAGVGGIYNAAGATLNIRNTTFSGNAGAGGGGGGGGGSATPNNNGAGGVGGDGVGAIANKGTLNYNAANITFTSNTGAGGGGGQDADRSATATSGDSTNNINNDGTLNAAATIAPEINVTGNSQNIADGDTTPVAGDHTDFGSVIISSGPLDRTFTIENTGNGILRLGGAGTPVTISGAAASDYTVITQPDTSALAPGANTTFVVRFDPSTAGARGATINIASDDANENPYNFNISGTGIAPEIDIRGNGQSITDGDTTPDLADHTNFGEQRVSSGMVSRTFSITNTTVLTQLILGAPVVSITGTNASDFSLTSLVLSGFNVPLNNNALNPLGGLNTVDATIEFNPSATGTRTATITVTSDDADEASYDFAVSGVGIEPEINVQGNGVSISDGDNSPSSNDDTNFGNQQVSSGTLTKTFTIQNTGNSALTLGADAVIITGASASDFSVTTQPDTTVAASGMTTFVVAFSPSAVGARSATINVANNDSDEGPFDFSISGTGTQPSDAGVISDITLPTRIFEQLPDNTGFGHFRNEVTQEVRRLVTIDNAELIQLDAMLRELWSALCDGDSSTSDDLLAAFENLLAKVAASETDTVGVRATPDVAPGEPQVFATSFSKQLLAADTFERERRALLEALS